MSDVEKTLTGRTIVKAEIDGYVVILNLDDGSKFLYEASDGGYSTYEIQRGEAR